MKNIYFFIFLITFNCCQKKYNSENSSDATTIGISSNRYKGKTNLENLIKEYKIIPLNYDKIISNIDKVKLLKDKIYVQDSKTIALLEFNSDGKFIKQIGRIGAGPGEYLSVHDFEIDEITGHIFILSLQKMSLIEYDKDGKYIKSFKIPVFASKFVLTKDKILFYLNSNSNELSGKCDLIILDREMNYIEKTLCRDNIADFMCSLSGDIGMNSKGVYVTKALENSIYYFDNNNLKKKYSINFEKHELPEEFRNSFSSYRKHALDYKYLSKPILENDNLLAFYYMKKSRITFFIFDKKRNISYDDEDNFEYIGFNRAIAGFGVIGLQGDYFVSKFDVDALKQEEFKTGGSLILEKTSKINPKNHVLVLFKLNLP